MIYSSLHVFSFPSLLVFVGKGIGMPLSKFGFVSVQEDQIYMDIVISNM